MMKNDQKNVMKYGVKLKLYSKKILIVNQCIMINILKLKCVIIRSFIIIKGLRK